MIIPFPRSAFAADGTVKMIVVTVVPSTATRIAGFAFAADGSLYVITV